ncbi:MAG TPA: hypothetical protein VIF81_02535 [Pyrinomonadaceae bacterium]|jgi:hypothetical protein
MPKLRPRDVALMISILLMGILLGGIVYAHVVFFPPYLSALPTSSVLVNGPYPLHDEYFWTLIHPLAILALIVALVLNWKIPARRKLIAVPLIVYVLAIVVTALYFVPELQNFKNSPNMAVTPAEWYARGQRWQHLSWTRGTVMGLSYISLLLALAWREDER